MDLRNHQKEGENPLECIWDLDVINNNTEEKRAAEEMRGKEKGMGAQEKAF